jgi:hypothetical protein
MIEARWPGGSFRRAAVATNRFGVGLSMCVLIGGCAFDRKPDRPISGRVDDTGAAPTPVWTADPLVNPPSLAALFPQDRPESSQPMPRCGAASFPAPPR